MKTFEERKEEYLDKLSNNMEIIYKLMLSVDEKSLRTARLMLDPSTDKELRLANGIVSYTEDMKELVEAAACGNVDPIPIEENEGITFLANIIQAMYEASKEKKPKEAAEEIAKKLEGNMDPKAMARMYYDLLVGLITSPDEMYDYMQNKTTIDYTDKLEAAKFRLFMRESQTALESVTPTSTIGTEFTEEQLEIFEAYVEEMHSLCQKGIKKNNKENRPSIKSFV